MTLPGGKKSIALAIGVIILVFLAYRLIWHRPPVPVMAVKKVEVQGKVHGPGTVQARVPVTVSAKITGILEKLYADQGELVQKGQLLAKLDAIELRAREMAAQSAKTALSVIWPGPRPIRPRPRPTWGWRKATTSGTWRSSSPAISPRRPLIPPRPN